MEQVKFPLYKYIMGIDKYEMLLFPLYIMPCQSLEKLVCFNLLLFMTGKDWQWAKSKNSLAMPIFGRERDGGLK